MRQLTRMFEEQQNEIRWEDGTIIIPDPAALERILPMYYKTSKFSSFQRQLNNFGYHRSYDNGSSRPVDRSKARGVCYRKVAGRAGLSGHRRVVIAETVGEAQEAPRGTCDRSTKITHKQLAFSTAPAQAAARGIPREPERCGALFGIVHVPQGRVTRPRLKMYIPLLRGARRRRWPN